MKTIIVTGAAGFIGSIVISYLNSRGYDNIIAVDEFSRQEKNINLQNISGLIKINRDELFSRLKKENIRTDFFFHIGARTDTTEFDKKVFDRLNTGYSRMVWEYCTMHQVPLIYASSAATYGLGEHGYEDDHKLIPLLKPLNPYGDSKNEFDIWVLKQQEQPPCWAGFKFFNVYGPNEYHKGRMASVIFHAFRQIQETGRVRLFRSHKDGYRDGEQLRDFIYVKDVVDVLLHFMENRPENGIYNLGTGKARTFLDLAKATFSAMGVQPQIDFIDTPADIRDKYQYFTEARMEKLLSTGYPGKFHSLESGIADYVKNYLIPGRYL
ncbi:MAG: ADP-glyceromanno-heptose 6-epimerase [Bacteroidetes bacterium]|nr:ADP-glyceromanno-heptose 6-epimerase [Bacteroidota bacterium]